MGSNAFAGIMLHAIGGLAAASFYIPYKKVKLWSWETYWLAGGFFSWIIAPWLLAMIILPQTPQILADVPLKTLLITWLFGVMWGVGGLTFGLTMRYLGIALGYAIALGLCAAFGTLVPPLVSGELIEMAATSSGQVILLGVFVCLGGIALSGKAGMSKEKELSAEQKKESVGEFNFGKGVVVAILAGLMSAAMAYGFAAGKPISEIALAKNSPELWQNLPVLIVILFGGFVTNCAWCLYLAIRNKKVKDFFAFELQGEKVPLLSNYLLCALAGLTWYLQFFFYGMGTTKMGRFEFSSWTLHMASIIIFSTLWGIFLKEWKGTGKATKSWIAAGLAVLILSTVIIGIGSNMLPAGGVN
ncbi:MAG: L-rhamnose/proton symporter RhaT [Phycisphaerae bacterium]